MIVLKPKKALLGFASIESHLKSALFALHLEVFFVGFDVFASVLQAFSEKTRFGSQKNKINPNS